MLSKSCENFIEELSSKSPIPGGGGVSAYVGSLGMALGSMVGNLTLGKKKYADVQEDIEILLEKSQNIINQFNRLVERDAEVFLPLSKAYGLPKETQEQKKEKERVLQAALVEATLVPLEMVRCCREAVLLHEEYAEKGTKIAISDVGVGVILCKAALQGAKLNVLINLGIMKDEELKNKVLNELNELENETLCKADEIYKKVEAQL